MEDQIQISTSISLKELLSLGNSDEYIKLVDEISDSIANELAKGKQVRKIMLPFSSDQPDEMPIKILQLPNVFQVLLTRRTISITYFENNNSSIEDLLSKINSQISYLLPDKNSRINKNNLRSIRNDITKLTEIESIDSLKEFINKTEYSEFSDKINPSGFSFEYYTDSDIEGIDSQSILYATYIDNENNRSGIRMTISLISGTFDFIENKFKPTDSKTVSTYINSVKSGDKIINLLRNNIYGLAESE